ncbi:hypothetical protein, conserved [Plasmodium vivax]|uniref:Uncharacterized protein n=1 Tax=Plasmodium vivax (strain Salvador I) TaxID=126793 RepID=A5K2S9_PLAVS|nr:hypothetical protein, conserved [Plasmodium vivax]EDL46729.1 hypothetical protein, conserved [Plasmodium vivax]|eukprot:XP_001616456.1 hypothetical protein [Plasmodium vivax Sal-1]
MNGFRANTNGRKWKYFNKGNANRNGEKGRFDRKRETYKKNEAKNVEEIMDYLINISYILNEKYEKYFVHELREDNLKKGNKCFGAIHLNYSYDVEDDLCILVKIKEEIKGSEKELADHRKCSKIMEKLIYYCFFVLKYSEKEGQGGHDEKEGQDGQDGGSGKISMQCIEIYNHFLQVICSDYLKLASSSYASHFVQTVICVYSFFRRVEEKYTEELKKRNRGYQPVGVYFKEICNVTTEKVFTLMLNKSGTHVLRSFLYSLGGYLNINISNISFRKSKVRGTSTRTELKYLDKGPSKGARSAGGDDLFYEYVGVIVKKVTEEIANPKVSLPMRNLLYQYVFYDQAGGAKESALRNGGSQGEHTEHSHGDAKYIMESQSQHFIPPLLYHTYAVPALGTLFELLKEKNVECDQLVREIFLIEKTKKYFINKTRENCKCHEESPLKQMLSILIKMDGPSIMIEKLLKMNSEPIFYVFNVYILKNINSLVCDNAYSCLVMCNYLTLEHITEEMFDLLVKNIDVDLIIRRKKFSVLRRLFDLAQCYQRNCKLLLNALLRWLHGGGALAADSGRANRASDAKANGSSNGKADGSSNGNADGSSNDAAANAKFLWICILCMRSYQDLHPALRGVFEEQKGKGPCEAGGKDKLHGDRQGDRQGDHSNLNNYNLNNYNLNNYNLNNYNLNNYNLNNYNLNNYNFYDHLKVDTNGYHILTHILSFPKESITPVTNSFRQFCNFLKIVNGNVASQEDVQKYNTFLQTFGGTHGGSENREEGDDAQVGDDGPIGGGKQMGGEHTGSGNNPPKRDGTRVKPFIRKNADLRGNILLYFACDKNLSVLCEKIAHTFNLINEKYLRNFILLFKSEYRRIASHYVGAHTIVTFFKLGTDEVKKKILDALVEGDINVFNGYIKSFMKLKEYKKTKTISTNSKKYLKAKEMFQDILAVAREKGGEAVEEVGAADGDDVDVADGEEVDVADVADASDEGEKEAEAKGPAASADKPGGEEDYMNLITDFIKNSKKKSRKRKKEKERIDQVLGKKAKCT